MSPVAMLSFVPTRTSAWIQVRTFKISKLKTPEDNGYPTQIYANILRVPRNTGKVGLVDYKVIDIYVVPIESTLLGQILCLRCRVGEEIIVDEGIKAETSSVLQGLICARQGPLISNPYRLTY